MCRVHKDHKGKDCPNNFPQDKSCRPHPEGQWNRLKKQQRQQHRQQRQQLPTTASLPTALPTVAAATELPTTASPTAATPTAATPTSASIATDTTEPRFFEPVETTWSHMGLVEALIKAKEIINNTNNEKQKISS